jgi:DNA-binding response OmpR family regulator
LTHPDFASFSINYKMLPATGIAKKKRILVVDDETDFALLQRVMPEYEIRMETRAATALAAAKRFHPDLFLIDLVMPDIHGMALARKIRRDRHFKKVPIVFVSALVHFSEECDEPVLIEEFPAFGKPFRIEALKRCIERQIHGDPSATTGLRRVNIGTLAGW